MSPALPSAPTSPERALDLVREAGGDELAERLSHLDRVRREPRDAPTELVTRGPLGGFDADVALVGGGLSLLLAPLLARRGHRVVVLERARAGVGHREWNASSRELEALLDAGLVTPDELERLVVARYREGTCRWHGGGSYPVTGALDVALDAAGLLAHARAEAERHGVTLLDETNVRSLSMAPDGARIEAERRSGERTTLSVRVAVDARGASSPHARADLVCPTVGGTLAGLREGRGPREIDPEVGEILATIDHVDGGRQHLWEAFPGRPGETTVYLFHYQERSALASSPGLVELFARFFTHLPHYKEGGSLVRPTFGLIPGWSRLGPPPTSPSARLVLVGDAAARHSPLTFCGFGSAVRSLSRNVARVEDALAGRPSHESRLDEHEPIHVGTGALALVLARASRLATPSAANELLDAAFASLFELGPGPYRDLLRDEASPAALVRFLYATSTKRGAVYADVARVLGLRDASRWARGLAAALARRTPSRSRPASVSA